MKRQFSIRLDDGLLQLVDARALERRTSRTEIVEEALVASLGAPLPVERSDGRTVSGRAPTARAPQSPCPPKPARPPVPSTSRLGGKVLPASLLARQQALNKAKGS